MEFLSLKELHRLPPLPQGKTSAQARYLTATTTAAQRLRAVGQRRSRSLALPFLVTTANAGSRPRAEGR